MLHLKIEGLIPQINPDMKKDFRYIKVLVSAVNEMVSSRFIQLKLGEYDYFTVFTNLPDGPKKITAEKNLYNGNYEESEKKGISQVTPDCTETTSASCIINTVSDGTYFFQFRVKLR